MSLRNWSGSYTYAASAVHRPGSLDELRGLVVGHTSLHAVGTRHAFSDIGDASELVSLSDLPGAPVLDATNLTATVPAATRFGDLARHLQAAGFALANLASLPHIGVAGSVATATHGSGNTNQSLASAVLGLTLLTSSGDLLQLDRSHHGFPGAAVNLGALGVVTELTLTIEPTYDVRQDVYEHLPWGALSNDFESVMAAGYSVSAITDFAGDDVDMLWVKTRLDGGEPSTMPPELFGARAATRKLHMTRGNDPLHCTPQLGEPGPWCDRLPHFLLEFTPSSGAEIQSEYLMDRAHAPGALAALRGLGDMIAPAVMSAEIRTVAADDLWLSPAYERDAFGVHFTWKPDAAAVTNSVAAIEAALHPFDPRPHWGKVFGRGHDWAALYPRLGDFQRLANDLDPRGVFRNDFLARTVLH